MSFAWAFQHAYVSTWCLRYLSLRNHSGSFLWPLRPKPPITARVGTSTSHWLRKRQTSRAVPSWGNFACPILLWQLLQPRWSYIGSGAVNDRLLLRTPYNIHYNLTFNFVFPFYILLDKENRSCTLLFWLDTVNKLGHQRLWAVLHFYLALHPSCSASVQLGRASLSSASLLPGQALALWSLQCFTSTWTFL